MLKLTCQLFGGNDKAKEIQDKYIPLYLPYLQNYTPEIMEEMKGMAVGANLHFQDIMHFMQIDICMSLELQKNKWRL